MPKRLNKWSLTQAPLEALIGESKAQAIVCQPSAFDPSLLPDAIAEVKALLCPFPAIRIADWFWETAAGQTVCRADWIVHHEEAIRPAQACYVLWGAHNHSDLKRLDSLCRRGILTHYWSPKKIAPLWPRQDQSRRTLPTYLLRSEVFWLKESGYYPGMDLLTRVVKPRYVPKANRPSAQE